MTVGRAWVRVTGILGVLAYMMMASHAGAQGSSEVSVYSLGVSADQVFEKARSDLVQAFTSAYAQGDTESFLKLFSDAARVDDKVGKSGIRTDYEKLFQGSASRSINLQNIKWHTKKGDDSYAIADFEAHIMPKSGAGEKVFRGAIELHVRKETNAVVISELYHAYDSASIATQ